MVQATEVPEAGPSFWDDLDHRLTSTGPHGLPTSSVPPGREGPRRLGPLAAVAAVLLLVVLAVAGLAGLRESRVSTVNQPPTTSTPTPSTSATTVSSTAEVVIESTTPATVDDAPSSTVATSSTTPAALDFSVVVLDGNRELRVLTDGAVIDYATIDRWLWLRAQGPQVGSARMELTGPQTGQRTDGLQPLTLTGGGWLPTDGEYVLVTTPFDTEGRAGQGTTIRFTVRNGRLRPPTNRSRWWSRRWPNTWSWSTETPRTRSWSWRMTCRSTWGPCPILAQPAGLRAWCVGGGVPSRRSLAHRDLR